MDKSLDKNFWDDRYKMHDTTWDVGYVSTPLKEYFDQLTDKTKKILIPGAGNSYEAEYLFHHGFKNVSLLDISEHPLKNFLQRNPDFPKENLLYQDFFQHDDHYDLIIEQTFFCALNSSLRNQYAEKMHSLLNEKGKLVGVLFDDEMKDREGPPFGGTKKEYLNYFSPLFHISIFERCYNSIPPRAGRELFMIFQPK